MEKDLSELINYLDERFVKIEKGQEDLRSQFLDLQGSVDGYAKRADTEMVMDR